MSAASGSVNRCSISADRSWASGSEVGRYGDAKAAQPAGKVVGARASRCRTRPARRAAFRARRRRRAAALRSPPISQNDCRSPSIALSIVFLPAVVRVEAAGDRLLLAVRDGREIGQHEVALRPFVENAARPVARQAIVGQDLQPDGGDAAEIGAELQMVGIGLGLVAADEDRIVRLDGQQRHPRAGLSGRRTVQLSGVLARVFVPFGEGASKVARTRACASR